MAHRLRFLNPKKTLFLLCDIQEKFRPVIPLFEGLVSNANKLTKAGKEFEIPLIVSEQFPEKLGKTVPDLDISHAAAIISKTQFSMLVPELENKIKTIYGEKPCDIVLYGLESHVCIEQTAIDFLSCGINVYIVADCCTSRLNQDRDLALDRLREAGCVITTSESIIFNLLRDKNNPKFNVIRKLVNPPSLDMQLAKYGSSSSSGSKL
ncbi:isochorismatase domain-containing protein 1-like [Bactrocera tryoni]|uniref:isochorismatase domain-containing protein 1-like n=1 Tax=Bactrocera tryoni TaxID=59916 RepID=UPI001A97A818|nr:isochorismatase domain-containing protein 1-like [Bactrocera tryoni]